MGKVLSGHIGEDNNEEPVKIIATLQLAASKELSTDSYLAIGEFCSKIKLII